MRLAHISDLHFGKVKPKYLHAVRESLLAEELDYILISGDITDRGTKEEYKEYISVFGELLKDQKIIVVPGNHDRLGDDVASKMMIKRVQVINTEELYAICVDSTGPHNYVSFVSHGLICHDILEDIDRALQGAKEGQLVAIIMHHHPLPLPTESLFEFVSNWMKWPFAKELHLGHKLIDLVLGRADLVLHGHKHTPSEFILPKKRPLQVCNAGCTPALKRYRIFKFSNGQLLSSKWKYI